MLPPGTVSRVPFQYPFRSGCPSAVFGAGADAAVAIVAIITMPAKPTHVRKITMRITFIHSSLDYNTISI